MTYFTEHYFWYDAYAARRYGLNIPKWISNHPTGYSFFTDLGNGHWALFCEATNGAEYVCLNDGPRFRVDSVIEADTVAYHAFQSVNIIENHPKMEKEWEPEDDSGKRDLSIRKQLELVQRKLERAMESIDELADTIHLLKYEIED